MISNPLISSHPVSFADKLAASGTFATLFKDGMALVEETAAYLDGAGREDSRALPRIAALSYASESMRLTTRLMQIASWLLLQRAVNEGEMSSRDAATDKRRSATAWQSTEIAKADVAASLPASLLMLIDKSIQLQDRVQRFDAVIGERAVEPLATTANPLETQLAMLRRAFPG